MSIYDMMEDISQKNITKSELGDNRMFGVTPGVVVKNYDKDYPGYVFVKILTRDKGDEIFQWARLAMGFSGKGWGHYFMPEINDQVLLAFEDGLFERPYVIASIPKDNDKFLTGAVHEKNQIKEICTRHGSHIRFDDCDEDKGAKDKITMETAGKTHKVILDNENKKIIIEDKKGKNSIEISTDDGAGNITILTDKKLTIKVGGGISMVMNDDTGAVSIKCKDFKVNGSSAITLATDGNFKATGAQVALKANAMFKAEAGGMATVKGTPVSLG